MVMTSDCSGGNHEHDIKHAELWWQPWTRRTVSSSQPNALHWFDELVVTIWQIPRNFNFLPSCLWLFIISSSLLYKIHCFVWINNTSKLSIICCLFQLPYCVGGVGMMRAVLQTNFSNCILRNSFHYICTRHWCVLFYRGSLEPIYICVSELDIVGSDNGLTPGRHQAIIWTNDGIF